MMRITVSRPACSLPRPPQKLADHLRSEIPEWRAVVRAVDIKP